MLNLMLLVLGTPDYSIPKLWITYGACNLVLGFSRSNEVENMTLNAIKERRSKDSNVIPAI